MCLNLDCIIFVGHVDFKFLLVSRVKWLIARQCRVSDDRNGGYNVVLDARVVER